MIVPRASASSQGSRSHETVSPVHINDAHNTLQMTSGGVIVAILGYSSRDTSVLHPICEARLRRGSQELEQARAVVLSGWARRYGSPSEAELMWQAWPEASVPVVSDPHSRTTAESALRVAALARSLSASEIRLVTSRWHMRRARFLFRGALGERDIRVSVANADDPPTLRRSLRELAGWVVAPAQLRARADIAGS